MADVQITTPILDAQGQLATPSVLSQIDARADARVKVRVPDSGTAGQVLQRTATGTAWADAPKGGSALVLSGPGRPDQPSTTAGTITGAEPVGAEYRSTDGAGVGAYRWVKRPGGAWAVTDGDTGWRNISALLGGTFTGSVRIKRSGSRVSFVAEKLLGSGSAHLALDQWAGFRVDTGGRQMSAALLADNSTKPVAAVKLASSSLAPYYIFGEATPGYGSLIWDTTDSWPSTLPGTPA